jgi:hypothetical protein
MAYIPPDIKDSPDPSTPLNQANLESWLSGAGNYTEQKVTAKGDLLAATGNAALSRLAVGTNGQVLTADSAQAAGVKWAAVAGGGSGGYALAIATKTAAYTLTTADETVLADATTAAFAVTLPTAVGNDRKRFTIKRINAGANNVTVATTGGQTVDGDAAGVTLGSQWASVSVISNGAAWFIE